MTAGQRTRALPPAFLRRERRVDELLALVPAWTLPLDVLGDLQHARMIVRLRPAEFAAYALASAAVLRMAERRADRP